MDLLGPENVSRLARAALALEEDETSHLDVTHERLHLVVALDLRAAESHEQELGHGKGRRRPARGARGLRGHGAALDDDHQEERCHGRHPRDAERRAEPHAIARERARIAPKGMAKS